MNFKSTAETTSAILESPLRAERRALSQDLFSSTLTDSPRLHRTFRSTSDDAELPYVIIPEDFEVEEFFATVATYYASQTPLTAYVHVLGKDVAQCFTPNQPNIVPAGTMSRTQLALLGTGLGETALAAFNSIEGYLNPSYSACKRSLGYALARAFALYPELEPNLTIARWERLRNLTGLTVSPAALRAINAVRSSAMPDVSVPNQGFLPPELIAALWDHINTPDSKEGLGHKLLNLYPGIAKALTDLKGSFDSRMGAFLKAVDQIQRTTLGPEVDSVAVGYLCNQILPGSFAHGKVLARLADFFPSALIWYGMLCAVSPEFDARNFGSGLFQKLWRDVSQPFSFSQRPSCDIALEELEVLARGAVKADAIKPTQQKIATVALLPGLDVFSRFVADDEGPSTREMPTNSVGPDPRLNQVTRFLEDAVALLHEMNNFRERRSSPALSTKRTKKKS